MSSVRATGGSGSGSGAGGRARPGLLQLVAAGVAATFVLVGILGFVPGITTDYGDLGLAGHESEAKLLGLFQVSVLHNLVHLGFGLVGLVMARHAPGARTFLVGGGTLYLAIWLYGLFIPHDSGLNFVPVNEADNWLHLALGLGMIALGLILAESVASRRSGTRV